MHSKHICVDINSPLPPYPPYPDPVPILQAAGDAAVREIMPSATIFKPGPLVGNEDRLTNNIAQLGKKYPLLPLVGGGTARLQPVYVRDVADALMASLRSRDSMGKDYYLAGPDVLTRAPGPRPGGAAEARQLCHDAAAGRRVSAAAFLICYDREAVRECGRAGWRRVPKAASCAFLRLAGASGPHCASLVRHGPSSDRRARRRLKEVYQLTFATMRERFRYIPVPVALARLLAMPRERLYKSARARPRPLPPLIVPRHAVASGSGSGS